MTPDEYRKILDEANKKNRDEQAKNAGAVGLMVCIIIGIVLFSFVWYAFKTRHGA